MLKYALGLATKHGDPFSLFYIYLGWPGLESEKHSQEIKRFAVLVDPGLRFKTASYQDLFASLSNKGSVDAAYMAYMRTRYFGNIA